MRVFDARTPTGELVHLVVVLMNRMHEEKDGRMECVLGLKDISRVTPEDLANFSEFGGTPIQQLAKGRYVDLDSGVELTSDDPDAP